MKYHQVETSLGEKVMEYLRWQPVWGEKVVEYQVGTSLGRKGYGISG